MKFKIVNGRVFDPSQKINDKKVDIYVKDGLIVQPDPSEKYEYKTTYDKVNIISISH